MSNTTNEEFLKSLAEDYPNVDWDNLPDLESSPDVYKVRFNRPGRFGSVPVEIAKEYASKEEAQAYVDGLMKDVYPEAFDVEIRASKNDDLTTLHICGSLRKGVLEGKLKFPIFLP